MDERWARVDIKSISLLPNVLAKQAAREQGAREGLGVIGADVAVVADEERRGRPGAARLGALDVLAHPRGSKTGKFPVGAAVDKYLNFIQKAKEDGDTQFLLIRARLRNSFVGIEGFAKLDLGPRLLHTVASPPVAYLLLCAGLALIAVPTQLSHDGICCVGINTDTAAVPDPEVLLDCVREGFDEVLALAKEHQPKMIICGGSAYPRHLDFARFRAICDEAGCDSSATVTTRLRSAGRRGASAHELDDRVASGHPLRSAVALAARLGCLTTLGGTTGRLNGAPEAHRPGYYYANTYDLPSRYIWEMEALTLHEAVPGHHLQIALAQELTELDRKSVV